MAQGVAQGVAQDGGSRMAQGVIQIVAPAIAQVEPQGVAQGVVQNLVQAIAQVEPQGWLKGWFKGWVNAWLQGVRSFFFLDVWLKGFRSPFSQDSAKGSGHPVPQESPRAKVCQLFGLAQESRRCQSQPKNKKKQISRKLFLEN